MKKLLGLLVMLVFATSGFTQNQYPIKTIYRGDSVVILTVQQSQQINAAIGKATKNNTDSRAKLQERDAEIAKLQKVAEEQNAQIDSLSDVLLWYLNRLDSVNAINDSLWVWALGPTLIYTQYPDDSTVYLMDLSHYYMTTDDFGIIMSRMSDREYKKYLGFVQKYGLSEQAFWQFKNEMRIKKLPDTVIQRRRVWKFKTKERKP